MIEPSPHSLPPDSQALEDLACAYWGSETLFAALTLNLFAHLAAGPIPLAALAQAADCLEAPLARLLVALARLGLVGQEAERWQNRPVASRHLVPDRPEYLGDFLLYRRYLQPPWQALATTVAGRAVAPTLSRDDDYLTRNRHYVRALDQLARLKAKEIVARLDQVPWQGPILDLGGGAGALSRALLARQPGQATLVELAEVIAAGRDLYPDSADWQGISTLEADFRSHIFPAGEAFALVLLANVLHTYDEAEARAIIAKAVGLMTPGGHLLIHDYCPDRQPIKGQLYDVNMLLNTAEGRCHEAMTYCRWLNDGGLEAQVIDLASDSSLVLARRPPC